ncbi:MAG: hypothetical protein KJ011_20725 [Burkholderiaceae bacterium]|nr:hypothetical protein [Burkholderiaceae bacterium]
MARAAASWRRLRADAQARPAPASGRAAPASARPARDARAACLRAAPLAALLGLVVGLDACASGPVLQGRGYHGNEYTLEARGTDPKQRTSRALRDASLFCESQGLGIVPGSANHDGTKTTLTFQCTDERATASGAARPAPAYGE